MAGTTTGSHQSNNLAAPLATISELTGFNSPSSQSHHHSNTTNTTTTTTTNKNNSTINIVINAANNGTTTSGNNRTESSKTLNASSLVGSINNNNSVATESKLKAFSLNSGNKYTSVGSINMEKTSSSFLGGAGTAERRTAAEESKNELVVSQALANNKAFGQPSSSSSGTGGKGLRNFFGKLIRTSLVNINDSSLNGSSEKTTSSSSKAAQSSSSSSKGVVSNELNTTTASGSSLFKRGGKRATANARLQNFSFSNNSLLSTSNNANGTENEKFLSKQLSLITNGSSQQCNAPAGTGGVQLPQFVNLDTLTFAKWPSEQVYEWLRKNGFEAYFTYNTDGTLNNKWIKNGLHLLQASQNDYEKVNLYKT